MLGHARALSCLCTWEGEVSSCLGAAGGSILEVLRKEGLQGTGGCCATSGGLVVQGDRGGHCHCSWAPHLVFSEISRELKVL